MLFVYEGTRRFPGVAVKLSKNEMSHADSVGDVRQSEAERMNLPDRHGFRGNGKNIHRKGSYAEIAVAKYLRIPWQASINTFKRGGDVGDFQVRARTKHEWDLIIRRDDDPDAVFYLVTGWAPSLRIVGWIIAKEGMRPEYLATHGGREKAYFVPHAALNPPHQKPPL